jgi:hypothetical protein
VRWLLVALVVVTVACADEAPCRRVVQRPIVAEGRPAVEGVCVDPVRLRGGG